MNAQQRARAGKRVFLVWRPSCTRSENQALNFGAEIIHITPLHGRRGLVFLAARYFVSFFATLRALRARRPDVIFTINIPPPLILAVYLYTRLTGGIYLMDSHSAPFNAPKWAWALPLYQVDCGQGISKYQHKFRAQSDGRAMGRAVGHHERYSDRT